MATQLADHFHHEIGRRILHLPLGRTFSTNYNALPRKKVSAWRAAGLFLAFVALKPPRLDDYLVIEASRKRASARARALFMTAPSDAIDSSTGAIFWISSACLLLTASWSDASSESSESMS